MFRYNLDHSKGLSILELSISLVIIAIITSGVIFGRSVVYHASISKFLSDVRAYKTLVHIFYNTFGCLPGDCKEERIPIDIVNSIKRKNLFCFDDPTIGNGKINGVVKSSCAFRQLREFDPKTFYRVDRMVSDFGLNRLNIENILTLKHAIADVIHNRNSDFVRKARSHDTSDRNSQSRLSDVGRLEAIQKNRLSLEPNGEIEDPIMSANRINRDSEKCTEYLNAITRYPKITMKIERCTNVPINTNGGRECEDFLEAHGVRFSIVTNPRHDTERDELCTRMTNVNPSSRSFSMKIPQNVDINMNILHQDLLQLLSKCEGSCQNADILPYLDLRNVKTNDNTINEIMNDGDSLAWATNICRDKEIKITRMDDCLRSGRNCTNNIDIIRKLVRNLFQCRSGYVKRVESIKRLLPPDDEEYEELRQSLDEMLAHASQNDFNKIDRSLIERYIRPLRDRLNEESNPSSDICDGDNSIDGSGKCRVPLPVPTRRCDPLSSDPEDVLCCKEPRAAGCVPISISDITNHGRLMQDLEYVHYSEYINVGLYDKIEPLLNIGKVNRENNPAHILEGGVGMFKLGTVCDPNRADIGGNISCSGIEPYENGRGLYRDNIGTLMLTFTAEHTLSKNLYIDKALVSSKMAYDMDCKIDDCMPWSGNMIAGKDCNTNEGLCSYIGDNSACTTAHGPDWESVANFTGAQYVADNSSKRCIISFKIMNSNK